ncbi:MAG TPA: aldehyde ferredoxin oxidoreductase [Chromatiales bacterium]|nr:aldehyde ferredoxin oxidoreductase [Thiotrichales bacterium]HIP69164.1 aldehyde ferredoxin oxidoreductase [Chromatiales bacterium]
MQHDIIQRELVINLNTTHWQVNTLHISENILGPVDYGWQRYKDYPDSFTFGQGLLAGSAIPGSRRLVFCAFSPQWDGFYVSSMGGAAYTFHGLGVSFVALRGRCKTPSVLILNHQDEQLSVRLEPVDDYQSCWQGYQGSADEELIGFFGLQQALFDRYSGEYHPKRVRVFAVGPAAEDTPEGIIGSSTIRKGKITPVVDWCGRGGLGSRLLQQHNIVGCVFGGEWKDPDLLTSKELDGYFLEHFGQKVVKADLAMTEKYRYSEKFQTGGTFGVNMYQTSDRLLTFNYTSAYASEKERRAQHKNFILDHYLKQFNEETIQPKNFEHCGEPCAVACKKLNGKYKKDYEPYQALGPQTGIFDQRAAEILNDFVDAMGFDAIQTGGYVAWIMECVAKNLIPADEFGFPPATELNFKFASDADDFDIVNDSMRNAKYAIAVVKAILTDERAAVFKQGIRGAAYEMEKRFDTRPLHRAVFLSHGEYGYMVPNQYWVPGMGSPMPIMGKYYVYYGPEFLMPAELGKKNVERMVYELFSDNTGICRFHRKWSESITDEILKSHFHMEADYKKHQYKLANEIHQRESNKSIPWETERMADLLLTFLKYWGDFGLKDPDLQRWMKLAENDKLLAAQAFWQSIMKGQADAFAAGPDAITDILTPAQAAASSDK